MAFVILRRFSNLRPTTLSLLSSHCSKFSTSRASKLIGQDRGHFVADRLHLSPLFSESGKDDMKDCKIELVDDAMWNVSSSLADAWRVSNGQATSRMRSAYSDQEYDDDRVDCCVNSNKLDPDFDEIEDMRIRGNLFYKLDKDSKEYEEYKFDFHRRKSAKNEKDRKGGKETPKKEKATRTLPPKVEMTSKKDLIRDVKKNKDSKPAPFLGWDDDKNINSHGVGDIKKNKDSKPSPFLGWDDDKNINSYGVGDLCIGKKQRTLTFNQQTAPYHEPFCLDIFVSKGSVRACIIHRATSNVVVVAHSISKDMKFDLGSTKNRNACAVVGKVLAQRALDDDIHNVVYTPRKGDRVEGKLEIVLKSIINGGVDVKVKLKQKKPRRLPPRTHDQHGYQDSKLSFSGLYRG